MTGILWGLLASIISVVNTGVYQRALSVAASYGSGPFFRAFFMNAVCVVLIAAILAVPALAGSGISSVFWSWAILAAVLSVSISGMISGMASQYAYTHEKISVLAPFVESGRVLTIIAGFALFSGTSVAAFVSALLAGLAIVAGSVDLACFRFNRYSAALAASGVLRAYSAICSGFILASVSPVPFALADVVFAVLIILPFALKEGFPKFSYESHLRMGKGFAWNNALWILSYLISLLLLKELGVVLASLLGMVSMVATVAYGKFALKESPDKKTVILALFVSGCIVFGSLYS